jgi:integral membrane sensor domain MASE1
LAASISSSSTSSSTTAHFLNKSARLNGNSSPPAAITSVDSSEPISTADWLKSHWSSRPQMQPPKEWNFIHPNSGQSKYNIQRKLDLMENKNSRNVIGQLIFTHVASFIVGATLMFIFLKRYNSVRFNAVA